MNKVAVFIGLALASLPVVNGFACGPDPQKVVESIEISAPMAEVVETLKHAELMAQWHPLVQDAHQQVNLPLASGEESTVTDSREIIFRNGWVLHEELRQPYKSEVIEDAWMDKGSFPVSQYRGVLQVKPGTDPDKVKLVWTARFNNQANTLEAPAGQDNATAVAAVTDFYRQGLDGLKRYLEASATHHTSNSTKNRS